MNINLSVRCDECSNQTNCRVGMSNRDIQPLKFSCRRCGSTIGLDFRVKDANGLDDRALRSMLAGRPPSEFRANGGASYRISGAKEMPRDGIFDTSLDFVDLHLDFPVVFGEYVPGNTPYLQAVRRAGSERADFHRLRLHMIDEQYKKYPQLSKLIAMYIKGYFGPFREAARKRFKVVVASGKSEDLNAALYKIVSGFVLPFTLPDDNRVLVREYTGTILDLMQNSQDRMVHFLREITRTKFLFNLQNDCLKIYKPILSAELPLRPALFLDLDPSYAEGTIAMRVSSQD